MAPIWADQPMMHIVPVLEGFLLHYETRTGSGSTISRHNNEKDAILWCKENAFEYTVGKRLPNSEERPT